MVKNDTAVLQQKVLLFFFLFTLVMCAGKVLYKGYNAFAECFSVASYDSDSYSYKKNDAIAVEDVYTFATSNGEGDMALKLYRASDVQNDVISFYSSLTGNKNISVAILRHADENNISPSLAFALSWEESRFTPTAVNMNSASVDRGLFQLNNKSFPNLSEAEMFTPDINAKYGLSHLRFCIDMGGNDITGLAMYNAGIPAVQNGKTPSQTLEYVSRILSYKEAADIALMQFLAAKTG